MGNQHSTSSTNGTQREQQANDTNNLTRYSAARDPGLRALRRCLKNDQNLFILNNLMLCVQFFENYEREIQEIRSTSVSPKEASMNMFLSQSQKHVILPGALEEQALRRVKFTSTRRSDFESMLEPVQPVRMYVVLDNVSFNNVAEIPNDVTSADSIFYKMRLEPSSSNGYVKLRSLGVTAVAKEQTTESSETNLPLIAESDDEEESVSVTAKPAYAQSMNDIYNVDGDNEKTAPLETGKAISQTNLVPRGPPDDEGYQELSYGGTSGSTFGGPTKQIKQLKSRSQSMQQLQGRRSIESTQTDGKSSGYKSSYSGRTSVIESDYGYAVSSISSTVSESDLATSSSEIPAFCFKEFTCTRNGKVISEEADGKVSRNPMQKRIRKAERSQIEKRSYLKSYKFRKYFKTLFVKRFAKPLGFESEVDTDVTRRGAIIHCYSMETAEENSTFVTRYEIVPSIPVELPKFYSQRLEQMRKVILDLSNKDTWLRKEMTDKIERLGCHIIPERCTPTKDMNSYYTAEWQLNFPAAERYLETCFTHPQAHVYLITLMLSKSFIRSTDPAFEFTASHIRSQLFWLLEENYSSFTRSEDRAGESLMELLNKVRDTLSQSQPCLADYFISKKNLLANIPLHHLRLTQKQFHRIIENPVMYMIASMKNIRYKSNFFPVLDYRRLFTLLVLDDDNLATFINPALSSVDGSMSRPETEEIEEVQEQFEQIGEFSVNEQTTDESGRKTTNNDSQELVIEIPHECAQLRDIRLTAFLDMFIKHFTKMAEHCYEYGAIGQQDIYLNQAQRLSMILRDQAHGKEDAEKYLDRIYTLRHKLSRFNTREDESGPSARSDQSTTSVPLNQFFTDVPDGQGCTLLSPNSIRKNEFDAHRTPAHRRPTVNLENQEETML